VRRRLEAGGVATGRVGFFAFPTDDAWVRDHGPVFLVRDSPIRDPERRDPERRDPEGRDREGQRERALVDFGFDAWGGKYPPWDRDDAIPRQVAEALALPRFAADFVLEGGSVDGDGAGTVLTTESCLLHPNRGAGRTRETMEQRLHEYLGAEQVLWLGDGIAGDDTDGHVDDVTRFVAPGTVVTALESDASDPNHAPLAENLRRLRRLRDARGKPLAVATLPMPPPLYSGGERLPASYANFYLANRVALIPVFGAPADERALAVLAEILPGREIVPIAARDLVHGLGAVHCLTQQEPAANCPV
jgi:agmatine deiminase